MKALMNFEKLRKEHGNQIPRGMFYAQKPSRSKVRTTRQLEAQPTQLVFNIGIFPTSQTSGKTGNIRLQIDKQNLVIYKK